MDQRWEMPAGFEGYRLVAGLDEVGRGPLAGPVVAAAVVLPAGFLPAELDDSKRLSARTRDRLAEAILARAWVGLAAIPAPAIDRLNIRAASLQAMARAFAALPLEAEAALVDGRDLPPDLPCPAAAIIGGDARIAAIAAASIVAKSARDRLMRAADLRFPGYGFAAHRGYPTAGHRRALVGLGLTVLHRRSFAPCRALAERR